MATKDVRMRGAMREETLQPVTRRDLEAGLQRLGLGRGYAVEVHSSLSSFGHVVGGAATIVDALMTTVGDGGSILMSAYPLSLPVPVTEEDVSRGIRWKVRILREASGERSGMGAIVHEFCGRPGVAVGEGVHRVAAWGHEAERHSSGYRHLLEVGGYVLLLGVEIYRCSCLHIADAIPLPQSIERIFCVPQEILRDYPADRWVIGYGDTPRPPWAMVFDEAKRQGLVRQERIGPAECLSFEAEPVVRICEDLRGNRPFAMYGLDGASQSP